MKLYEINQAITQLVESANPETGEVDVQAFEDLALAKEEKQKNIVMFCNHLESDQEAIEKEIDRLTTMKKRAESGKRWLMGYLKNSMEQDNITELDFVTFKAKIKKNPPKVVIHDETKLYARFGEAKTVMSIKKDELKEALKTGEHVDGAVLVQDTRLEIK